MVAKILHESQPIVDLTETAKLKGRAATSSLSIGKELFEINSCHNVVVDPQGNWVTMMHTLNGTGVPGLVVDGVPCYGGSNNAPCTGPGRRIRHPINPVLVMRDGSPFMSLGSPGDVQHNVPIVLANIFGFGMDPYAALDAPRFHPVAEPDHSQPFHSQRWSLEFENRISREVVAGLLKKGIQGKPLGAYNYHTGSMQIVWRDLETGRLKGATDPRRTGHA